MIYYIFFVDIESWLPSPPKPDRVNKMNFKQNKTLPIVIIWTSRDRFREICSGFEFLIGARSALNLFRFLCDKLAYQQRVVYCTCICLCSLCKYHIHSHYTGLLYKMALISAGAFPQMFLQRENKWHISKIIKY